VECSVDCIIYYGIIKYQSLVSRRDVISAAVFETRAIFPRALTSFSSCLFPSLFTFSLKACALTTLIRYLSERLSRQCDILDLSWPRHRGHYCFHDSRLSRISIIIFAPLMEFIPAMHRHSSRNILAERVINATFPRSFAHSACLAHAPFSTCAGYIPPSYYCLDG